jgi:hypothetical protein
VKDALPIATASEAVERLLSKSSPVIRQVYSSLLHACEKFGPVKQDPKKTSIHLVNRTAFAGVVPRQGSLILTVKAAADIQSHRFFKREQVSANRWHLEMRLERAKDVDGELSEWLRMAYTISA